ncbi:hypothetical protein MTO96_009996 [Rhipicephalus appendiculatus]
MFHQRNAKFYSGKHDHARDELSGPLGDATASRRHALRTNESTISNSHRPPYGGNKQDHPGPPRWPAYPRPPFGYGVPVWNTQVPTTTTPRPPTLLFFLSVALKARSCEAALLVLRVQGTHVHQDSLSSSVQEGRRVKEGGCFYKSERYEHGDSVETPEPCLNCTCQKGVLVCYLRVCPTVGTPAPGCFTARETGQYSFAPKPVIRPYDSGIDEVELSARTPSVIIEQPEQSTTAEVDVTTTTTDSPSKTTTTTAAAAQTSPEATTCSRSSHDVHPDHNDDSSSNRPGTSSTPEDVVGTVTAMGIPPTSTSSLPVETTTTALVDFSEVTTATLSG